MEKRLTEIEKAQLIKENRNEARDLLASYKASQVKDEENPDALYRYAELHRENTEIAPASCPRCWAEYGEALSMIGWVWWYSHQDILKEIEEKPDLKKLEKLKKEAERHRQEWVKYFQQSNSAYETHFQSVVAVHPYTYERVMRHHELLGDYQKAIHYLDETVESHSVFYESGMEESTRKKFENLRALYKRELEMERISK